MMKCGVIFLFKFQSELYSADGRESIAMGENPGVFFAKQTVNNACATQAILGVLMNAPEERIALGPILQQFKSFASFVDYEMRGDLIGQQSEIRSAHNSFARADPF